MADRDKRFELAGSALAEEIKTVVVRLKGAEPSSAGQDADWDEFNRLMVRLAHATLGWSDPN